MDDWHVYLFPLAFGSRIHSSLLAVPATVNRSFLIGQRAFHLSDLQFHIEQLRVEGAAGGSLHLADAERSRLYVLLLLFEISL